jgi:hypothetical protein
MPIGVDDLCAEPPDADGDGARADLDCDDANPSIRPGAEEVCGDGVDQDCADGDAACPPPGDLGIPVEGDAAADPGDAALGGDGASGRPSAGARPGLEGGCGCRIASASTRGATTGAPLRATWLLLALAVARRRRRRAPM